MPFPKSTQKQQAVQDAYAAWQTDANDENFRVLTGTLQPTVDSALQSYGAGDPSLRTRAHILATQAIRTYKPEAGASLSTHVFNNMQRLQRFRAERSRALHIPENVRMDKAAVDRYVNDHVAQHDIEPSDFQISDVTGLSMKRIKRTRSGGEISEMQAEGEKGDLPASRRRTAAEIWTDYVYHDLDERNRKIFEWTTGYNGRPVLQKQEIAKRLRVTPAAVSIRISQIMKKLQEGAE